MKSYYDTVNAGPKTEKGSYEKIAEVEGVPPDQWLFLSDNVKGLFAPSPPLFLSQKEG